MLLRNYDTLYDCTCVDLGAKVVKASVDRGDQLLEWRIGAVEADNGSYDASTTMFTHETQMGYMREVLGDMQAVGYCDARRKCKVQYTSPQQFASWTLRGQMGSGWPDTTISNTVANMLEMTTALSALGVV